MPFQLDKNRLDALGPNNARLPEVYDLSDLYFGTIPQRYTIPPDVHPFAPLLPQYWQRCLQKMIPGNTIRCETQSFDIVYELFIQECVESSGYLRFAARPIILPTGVSLPDMTEEQAKQPRPRYSMRPQLFSRHTDRYEVFDTTNGTVVEGGSNLERAVAVNRCQEKNDQHVRESMSQTRRGDGLVIQSAEELGLPTAPRSEPRQFVPEVEMPSSPAELKRMLNEAGEIAAHQVKAQARRNARKSE